MIQVYTDRDGAVLYHHEGTNPVIMNDNMNCIINNEVHFLFQMHHVLTYSVDELNLPEDIDTVQYKYDGEMFIAL